MFTNYIGVYQKKVEDLSLPFYVNVLSYIPFSFNLIKQYNKNILYLESGFINHYPEISTNLFSPVIFSIKVCDKFGNIVNMKNIIDRYSYSVPLNVIVFNESLVGEFIEIQVFRNNNIEKIKISLSENLEDSFGNIIHKKLVDFDNKDHINEILDREYEIC